MLELYFSFYHPVELGLDPEPLVDVLNKKTIGLVIILLPRTAHRPRNHILRRIDLSEARSITLENTARCIHKLVPALLIKCVEMLVVKSKNDVPKPGMNDIVIVQKIDQSLSDARQSDVPLAISRTRSGGTHMPNLHNLRMVKLRRKNATCPGRIINNDPRMRPVKVD